IARLGQGGVWFFTLPEPAPARPQIHSLTFHPLKAKFLWAPWSERHSLTLRSNHYLGSLVL
ncbi:MFS transporter, partial [Pseudomonas syringae pv. tagetis]